MSEQLDRRKELKSQAKKIRTLFTKQKKGMKKYYSTTDFENPVLFLIRRNKKCEFYEKATKGWFEFEHSDGQKRKILLEPSLKIEFPALNKWVSGYICHEDYALPLPHKALLTTEVLGMHETQVLSSLSEFEIKKERAKALTIKQLVTALAIIAAAFIMWVVLKPDSVPAATQIINETVRNIPGNISIGG